MPRVAAVLLAVLLAIATVVALSLYSGGLEGRGEVTLDEVRGEVAVVRDGADRPGVRGAALAPGDKVRTGPQGAAVLSRAGRSPVTLAGSTSVELVSVSDDVIELALEEGRVTARVRPDAGAVRINAGDRSVLATDADFGVSRMAEALQVEVQRGGLAMSGVSDVAQVREGQRLHVLPDGSSAVRPLSDELLLDVDWPEEGKAERVTVAGTTEPGAMVTVQASTTSAPVRAGADGRFSAELSLAPGENEVEVVVRDGFGRERMLAARVVRDTQGPVFELELDYARPR